MSLPALLPSRCDGCTRSRRFGACAKVSLLALWVLSTWVLSTDCASRRATVVRPVAPQSPPEDDGLPSQETQGGLEHAQALEELGVAPLGWALDHQHSIRVMLPDAPHWLRVRLWTVKTLVTFRYGKDHHALVAGAVLHVPNENAPQACTQAVENRAQKWIDAFSIVISHDRPQAFPWDGKIVDVDPFVATIATLGNHEQYAAAYATFPAWPGACLILGVTIPSRGELTRAKAARDRFVRDVFPKVQLLAQKEPPQAY